MTVDEPSYVAVEAAIDDAKKGKTWMCCPHCGQTLDVTQMASALGRIGGRKGGRARAAKLTPERRREIAKKAAKARWSKRHD